MATYFVSSGDGNDGDSGLTLDLAWATLEYALESGGLAAGDTVMVRRTHSEVPVSDIAVAYTGTMASPIIIAGLHRGAHAISSSDWTNGSTSVTVDDNDMDREKHQARYITAPDGETYLITDVTAATTIIIDREYAGGTVANDATASIQADDVISAWTAYDDSGDIIKKAGWEADADDMPLIDFNDGNFDLYFNNAKSYFEIKNIEFIDSADSNGLVQIYFSKEILFEGCLFAQNASSAPTIYCRSSNIKLKRFTMEGSSAGGAQRGFTLNDGIILELVDGAIYNMGDCGIYADGAGKIILNNVNIGIESANDDSDICFIHEMILEGYDVRLGGTNGLVTFGSLAYSNRAKAAFENYQKTLGENRVYYVGGYYERVAVVGETPNKKNSDYVIKITPNVNQVPGEIFAYEIPILVASLANAAYTFTFDIYNDSGVTINDGDAKADIWLVARYTKAYDDTSEYVSAVAESTENTIADAADADDWDSLSVSFTPAVASNVTIYAKLKFYSAAGTLFIDTQPVVT